MDSTAKKKRFRLSMKQIFFQKDPPTDKPKKTNKRVRQHMSQNSYNLRSFDCNLRPIEEVRESHAEVDS